MVNQIQVDQIINYMNTVTNITNLVGNRIYFGLPINEKDLVWDYITINIISETNQPYNKWTLLEFAYISNSNSTFKNLMDIRKIVFDELKWKLALWTMNVYSIIEEWVSQWYWNKNQKTILQDLRFYFIT